MPDAGAGKAPDDGLAAPFGLFVNIEPAAVGRIEAPTGLRAAPREWGIGLVIELTERALTDDPTRLLALADWAGRVNSTWPQGDGATGPALPVGVALDDVGADPTHWR